MGIPERKRREKERRRQQILIAARRVIKDKGYLHSTIEDVAKEAELSPGTLYLYFKNKEELFFSISIRIYQYLAIRLEQMINAELATPEERIESLKQSLLDTYEFDPQIVTGMFRLQSNETLLKLSFEVITEISELARECLNTMVDILKTSVESDAFINHHPIALADILWGIFSGVILREDSKKVTSGKGESIHQNLALAFEIFFRGLNSLDNLPNRNSAVIGRRYYEDDH